MKYAVIETGGKQYVVTPGESLSIEKLPGAKTGGKVIFDKVLLLDDGGKVQVGTPYVSGAKIEAEVTGEGRGDKITVLKYKRKTRYRVKQGHRQPFTKVRIAGSERKPKTATNRPKADQSRTVKTTAKKATTKKTTKKTSKK